LEQPFPGLRQPLTVTLLLEEGLPKIPFQSANASADRRGIHPEHRGGVRDLPTSGDAEEYTQVIPVHALHLCRPDLHVHAVVLHSNDGGKGALKSKPREAAWPGDERCAPSTI
jgi:hypothetical protein